ncbi:hypothetical protein D046_5027, partial [Vibrio parahaemolyticus V-223/04]
SGLLPKSKCWSSCLSNLDYR